jgi:pyruvate-formate lyase-activating enzyme
MRYLDAEKRIESVVTAAKKKSDFGKAPTNPNVNVEKEISDYFSTLSGQNDVFHLTAFNEERMRPNNIEIDVTSRCNFACPMCFRRTTDKGPDMKFSEFKKIIDGLVHYRKRENERILRDFNLLPKNEEKPKFVKFSLCVGGGEPFLNPKTPEMLAYAIRKLGREHISVTTNFSLLPDNVPEMVSFLKRCGFPNINISVDVEHLNEHGKIKSNPVPKLKAFFKAAKITGIKARVITTAVNAAQEKKPIPSRIKRHIPRRYLRSSYLGEGYLRPDNIRPANLKHIASSLNSVGGRNTRGPVGSLNQMRLMHALQLMPVYGGSFPGINFLSNGKVRFVTISYLQIPQLNIGNWKRESITDILRTNLPFRAHEVIRLFYGMKNPDPLLASTKGEFAAVAFKRRLAEEIEHRQKAYAKQSQAQNPKRKQQQRISLPVLH